MLQYSEACERNQQPILNILGTVLAGRRHVLEIGSGTGQHAVFFAGGLPDLVWQPTDCAPAMPGLRARLDQEAPPNVGEPASLDVRDEPWPALVRDAEVDAVFTANTLHIMSWECVQMLFDRLGSVVTADATLCVYGPFRYSGEFTTPSNAVFDQWLQARDSLSGVREFEAIDQLARDQGFALQADHAMPANNQLLVWQRNA
jgi:hypothetical protein